MKTKLMKYLTPLILVGLLLTGCSTQGTSKSTSPSTDPVADQTKLNNKTNSAISSLDGAIADKREEVSSLKATLDNSKPSTEASKTTAGSTDANTLANLDYTGQQEITVNNNDPAFSKNDLSTAKGAWAAYSDLDSLNRVTDANALLNRSLMPSAKREPLTWNPTGWHNKRTAHGWLYNRSHLIGYQLTGENNNPKNLMTGTQTLNSPLMLAHEMDIAYYLKQSNNHYVRYEVKPIFRGNELVARGVQMRAQSIGDNTIHFNVYIFNVEPGYTINYADGTSTKN
ncbi:XRE family transcriptional regulator [Lactobacillus sp. HMSC075D02]|uniref:DNA/RNA non-specific endonuclease n=1 Tax=Lacticaseibacillus rhamnosus TaxID=47715 RepID=UPI0007DB1EFB|nr:DNA/RNA non-specific endonuclease [Lacticaseibacillus rhamnosus]OAK76362.1 XRE family transcriptional regulator [Lacticaseibacillus rhamnosus]OAU28547.1 XRE family transcriptional regulator [Lacticaseibacillus rhamnosus]OFP91826.1 XRE family transcriptional regulator [Lactobacillus sp. HMSC075D02]QEW11007.1 DNA/RNA endonuclease [Lacticaseibacillus rhamnosus]